MKNNFLTIPDAPDYEINSDLIVRKKSTGRILKATPRIGKNFSTVTLFNNSKVIKRNVETFRKQAVTAFKDSKIKSDDWWQPIPSLNNRYEINPKGVLRNARSKQVLSMQNCKGFHGYALRLNNKSVRRTVKSLLWETHGITCRLSVCPPIATTIVKGAERLYFSTLADLSKFFVCTCNKKFDTVYRYIRRRPAAAYGWNITYHKPDDIGNVKMTVCKALKGVLHYAVS